MRIKTYLVQEPKCQTCIHKDACELWVQQYCSPKQAGAIRKSWEDYLNNDAIYWEFIETIKKTLPGIVMT